MRMKMCTIFASTYSLRKNILILESTTSTVETRTTYDTSALLHSFTLWCNLLCIPTLVFRDIIDLPKVVTQSKIVTFCWVQEHEQKVIWR